MIKKVLFDLDGTFIDSAHDLVKSANDLYKSLNKHSISFEEGREIASDGIKAFLNLRFDEATDDFPSLTAEFIKIYKSNILNNPVLFDGIGELINFLDYKKIGWGIITNKHRCFVEIILKFVKTFMQLYELRSNLLRCLSHPLETRKFPVNSLYYL